MILSAPSNGEPPSINTESLSSHSATRRVGRSTSGTPDAS